MVLDRYSCVNKSCKSQLLYQDYNSSSCSADQTSYKFMQFFYIDGCSQARINTRIPILLRINLSSYFYRAFATLAIIMVQTKWVACSSKLHAYWPAVASTMNWWTFSLREFFWGKGRKDGNWCLQKTNFCNWFLYQAKQNRGITSIYTTSKFICWFCNKKIFSHTWQVWEMVKREISYVCSGFQAYLRE